MGYPTDPSLVSGSPDRVPGHQRLECPAPRHPGGRQRPIRSNTPGTAIRTRLPVGPGWSASGSSNGPGRFPLVLWKSRPDVTSYPRAEAGKQWTVSAQRFASFLRITWLTYSFSFTGFAAVAGLRLPRIGENVATVTPSHKPKPIAPLNPSGKKKKKIRSRAPPPSHPAMDKSPKKSNRLPGVRPGMNNQPRAPREPAKFGLGTTTLRPLARCPGGPLQACWPRGPNQSNTKCSAKILIGPRNKCWIFQKSPTHSRFS